MKICVFQSAYESVDTNLKDVDPSQDPSFYPSRHTFENRWLKKDTANAQIDAAIAEGFDLYFNFLWGQYEDEVAGIEAVQYLEARNVPFVGLPSRASNMFLAESITTLTFARDFGAIQIGLLL